MTKNLRTALDEAAKTGWAVGAASLDELKYEGTWWLNWITYATRNHPSEADELRPTAQADAHPSSLSATYGTGEQPLHTDGAHLLKPGRWLLLTSAEASSVPTLLWLPNWREVSTEIREAMHEGLFTVVNGPKSFLAPARRAATLRFDLGCMRPSDGRAMRAAEFLSTRRSDAIEHVWDRPGTFLLLDNHRAMHARGDAGTEPDRVMHRINFDLPKAVKR